MKYRKYIHDVQADPERLDVKGYPTTPGKRFRVVGRRRTSPGHIEAEVTATDATEARTLFESGAVPAIGLGWQVVSVEEIV